MKELDLKPLYSADASDSKPIHYLVVLYWFHFFVGNPGALDHRCSTNGLQLLADFFHSFHSVFLCNYNINKKCDFNRHVKKK